jgi:energy-coupling factor transport system ATP-binding protein
MNTEFEHFLDRKLTHKDLDKFTDLLNDLNNNYNQAFEDQLQAKREYLKKEISKDQYQVAAKTTKEKKRLYKEAARTTVFHDNYKMIRQIYRKTKVFDEVFPKIEAEYLTAKKLYLDSKEAIKIKGKNRVISKLNDKAIKVKNLSFKYNERQPYALKNINLEIKAGEYVTIVGHNGSGKSTLSKLLIGVLSAQEGTIEVFGNTLDTTTVDRIRHFLGIVFQNPDNQFIGATVQDDIAFGLENKRIDPKQMQAMIVDAAKRVNMIDYLEKEPYNLSGGQKQRVAIASTLALNPDILIFDEATSMLDPKGKNEIKEIMLQLKESKTKTIISITHDMDEIMNASKVIVMNQGEVVRVGSPKVIMKDKEFLRKIHLQIPFLGEAQEALEKQGIIIKNPHKMEDLVKELWKQI